MREGLTTPLSDFMEHSIKMGILGYKMLIESREYVIKLIKAPLQKAIELAARRFEKRFGRISKENTLSINVHSLLDIRDWFFSYKNMKGRRELLDAIITIVAGELEHDPDYRFFFDIFLEEILKKILKGEWEPSAGTPNQINWPDEIPYLLSNSFTYKLLNHRDEILKLIGEGA